MGMRTEFTNCKICNNEIGVVNSVFKLVKCHVCELVFSQVIFSDNDFINTYNQLYNATENLKYRKHSILEYNQLKNNVINIGYNRGRMLNKVISKGPQNFLEIGSGIGLIGMYLKKFNNISYLGLELDEKTHKRALSLGVKSINGDFSIMTTISEKFDVIMMWEVLEHLQNLDLFFQLAKEKLNPEGVLVFSVPNFDKKGNYLNAGNDIFQSGPPIHLNFFTKKSVKNVLEKYDFKVVEVTEKKFPYFNFKTFNFYKMIFKSLMGKYNGPTLYVIAKLNKRDS